MEPITELVVVNARDYQIIDKRLGVEAVVAAADESMSFGEFPFGQIIQCAGPNLSRSTGRINGCKPGKAEIKACDQQDGFQYVIFTVDPRWLNEKEDKMEVLAAAYQSCLETAVINGVRSVAFPSIGTLYINAVGTKYEENNPLPLDKAVKTAVRTVKQFVSQHPGEIDVIKWVLYDEDTLKAYIEEIER